jgi:ParB-like chromosome segregation protein Spo0J
MAAIVMVPNKVLATDIVMEDRARKDYGDIQGMINSIKEFGLIQPLVLAQREDGKL